MLAAVQDSLPVESDASPVALDRVLTRIREHLPHAQVEIENNPGPSGQHSLVLGHATAIEVVRFLRDDPKLRLDFLSNATGVDWLETVTKEKKKVREVVDGEERDVEKVTEKHTPAYMEAVYHLYSVALKHGPVVIRLRTDGREPGATVPSLTPLFKGAEFQEREIYDLYGIHFTGHPDLRRLLMWENFADHPMRKDYAPPADDEAAVPGVLTVKDAAPPVPRPHNDKLLEVSLGPQHPSTHGVFRMNVVLDGETVVQLKPVFGYLHRNHEQIAERASYLGSMPYTDRLDYFCSLTNNWGYAMAVEKLADIDIPERAEYIRVITAEFTRLVNHTSFLGFFLSDMGSWGTVLMYAFREREKIMDLFEALTGARMMCNYMRFGGCRCDLPAGWLDQARTIVANYPRFMDEMEKLMVTNEILVARTQGVGTVSGDRAVAGSLSGPILRASGVNYDIRKVDRYGIYDRFNFRVPLGATGDCYDRFMLRILEIRESLKILEVALRDIPEGPIMNPKVKPRAFRPPRGEAYGRIEGPKGELGFHVISTGQPIPYRYHVRPPSLINLTLLEEMCIGTRIADVMVILGSIDIVLGEVDR